MSRVVPSQVVTFIESGSQHYYRYYHPRRRWHANRRLIVVGSREGGYEEERSP